VVGAKACYVFPTQMGPLGNIRRLAAYWELLFLMVGRDLKAPFSVSALTGCTSFSSGEELSCSCLTIPN